MQRTLHAVDADLFWLLFTFLPKPRHASSENNPQQNVQIHWLRRRCILTEIGAEKNGI